MESGGLERPQIEGAHTLDVDLASKRILICSFYIQRILGFLG